MPLTKKALGDVLQHIYDFPFEGAVFVPHVSRYEAATPCIVAWAGESEDWATLHQACLNEGFTNWLNIAVVSDSCDDASEQTETALIAAFNEDCREGGWLHRMMNYRGGGNDPDAAPGGL